MPTDLPEAGSTTPDPHLNEVVAAISATGSNTRSIFLTHLLDLSSQIVPRILEAEIHALTEEGPSPSDNTIGYKTGETFQGQVSFGEHNLLLQLPRLIDITSGEETPLESYSALQDGVDLNKALDNIDMRARLFQALVFHDYEDCASTLLEVFGLHQLSMSQLYKKCCTQYFRELDMLTIEGVRYIGLWIDGVYVADQHVCLCMGITSDYQKKPIAYVRASEEATHSLLGLSMELSERGFEITDNLLIVVEGSPWLSSAVREAFGVDVFTYREREQNESTPETPQELDINETSEATMHSGDTGENVNGLNLDIDIEELYDFDQRSLQAIHKLLVERGKSKVTKNTLYTLALRLSNAASSAFATLETMNEVFDHLGVNKPQDATHMLHSLRDQIEDLYADKEKLQDIGVSNLSEAIAMVRSMEEQLQLLYKEKEISNAATKDMEEGDMYQNLEKLYAERETVMQALNLESFDTIPEMVQSLDMQLRTAYAEKDLLQKELNVSSTDELIEMFKGMEEQLRELYHDRSEFSQLGIGEAHQAGSMLKSMKDQLNDLYTEKNQLMEAGWESTTQLLEEVKNLQMEISRLKGGTNGQDINIARILDENDRLRETINFLKEKFDVADPRVIPDLVDSMREQLEDFYRELDDLEADKSISIDDSPSIVHYSKLKKLESTSTEELERMNIGIIKLDDDGNVLFFNNKARVMPGLTGNKTVLGQNFFKTLAPATNNRLFFGRFIQGVTDSQLNIRFRYTYIQPKEKSLNFVIHLHRKPESTGNWMLFKQF